MKLTNYMRDSFIDKVLSKTVNIDYVSQVQELINKEALSKLPEHLRKKETLHYLEKGRVYFDGARCMGSYYVRNCEYKPSDETKESVKAIHKLFEQQLEKKELVKRQLRAVIYGCSSLKKAKEVLPENLHQYLPIENAPAENNYALVTTELMDNLTSLGMQS